MIRMRSIAGSMRGMFILLACAVILLAIAWRLHDLVGEARERTARMERFMANLDDMFLIEERVLSGKAMFPGVGPYKALSDAYGDMFSGLAGRDLSERAEIMMKLGMANGESRSLMEKALDMFYEIAKDVRYIHSHHVAYLENFLSKPDSVGQARTETSLVGAATDIHAGLFPMMESFRMVKSDPGSPGVEKLFSESMKEFYSSVSGFESLSLDAQDGILVEELLLAGREFERTFRDLIDTERQEVSLRLALEENRRGLLDAVSTRATDVREWAKRRSSLFKVVQAVILVVVLAAVIGIVRGWRRISSEIRKIGVEAGRMGDDPRYRIGAKPNDTYAELFSVLEVLDGLGEKVMRRETMLEKEIAVRKAATRTAEEASRAKSAFLAGMSHEIRTPLAAVMGMLDLCVNDMDAGKPVDRGNLDSAKAASVHLLSLINDVLDFSKIEAGRIDLSEEEFDLAKTCSQVLGLFRANAAAKGVVLVDDIRFCSPLMVVGDQGRLTQILINLVGNALKFTDSGKVILSGLVEDRDGKTRVSFSVSDTGVGIPENRLDAIFDEFVQASSNVSRRYGGTGLGLAICKRLVNLMGGDIAVSSTVGKGSRFSFTVTMKAAAMAVENNSGTVSAMVVDDNPMNRMVAEKVLLSMGHTVVVADSGERCLDMLSGGDPVDIVFMDIEMPGMDGFETARRIRESGMGTAVFAMTAHAPGEVGRECAASGMDGVVQKPLSMDAAARVIAKILTSTEKCHT